MKIGLAQIDCLPEDRDKNISKFYKFAAQAKSEGCDVVAFPEMSDTGYITSLIPKSAQTWSGSAYKQASSAARSNAINLVCSISEKRDSAVYNSVACFDRAGQLIAHYRKIHLFSPAPVHEDRFFKAGDKICTAQIGGLKWGISICFDLRFPEIYRYQTVQGAEILLNCTACLISAAAHWEHLTRARAIENQAFFVGADRVGTDGDLTFNGHSRIVSPSGEIIVDGAADKEELVVGDIDIESLINFRNAIPAISLRRDDIYGNFNIIPFFC